MTERSTYEDRDELLSAFIDGALSAPETERLRDRLAAEPHLAERLRVLEAANAKIKHRYDAILTEPIPGRLRALIDRAEVASVSAREGDPPANAPSPARDSNVVGFRPPRRATIRWTLPFAAAAGIAFAIGLGLGVLLPREPGGGEVTLAAAAGGVPAGSALHDLLESAPSAAARELVPGLSATPQLTFKALNGSYCRELELTSAQGRTDALACRDDGAWRLDVVSFEADAATHDDALFRPATETRTPVDDAVDAAIDGPPLGPDEERALIARGWQSRAP